MQIKVGTALAALLCLAATPNKSVEDLAWISGAWVAEGADGWTEEQWTAPRGGILLGINRSGRTERASGFEFMRIAEDGNGAIHFWGSPGGKTPVPFLLVSSAHREAVFENPKHDYPTRIVYRREGDKLLATVSGPGGRDAMSWSFNRSLER